MDIERELQTWRTKLMAWKDTAVENAIVLELVIKEMVKDRDIPTQLVETVDTISMISSEIEVFIIIQVY